MPQENSKKRTLLTVGAVILIILAVVMIYRQATLPSETINEHPERIPPKGASAHESKQ